MQKWSFNTHDGVHNFCSDNTPKRMKLQQAQKIKTVKKNNEWDESTDRCYQCVIRWNDIRPQSAQQLNRFYSTESVCFLLFFFFYSLHLKNFFFFSFCIFHDYFIMFTAHGMMTKDIKKNATLIRIDVFY